MFCTKCGAKVNEDDRICLNCGNILDPAPKTQPAVKPVMPPMAQPVEQPQPQPVADAPFAAAPHKEEKKMSFCTQCGTALQDGQTICPNCGKAKSPVAATQPAAQPVAAQPAAAQPVTAQPAAQPVVQPVVVQPVIQQPVAQPVAAQPYPQQPVYQQPPVYAQQPMYQPTMAPACRLSTNRGLLKYILLSIITFGIYGLVVMSKVSTDINIIATRYDGRKTMHFLLITFIFAGLTFGIAPLVWYHRLSDRIGNELIRRQIGYSFSAASFWLWNILGSLIIIGPFVYIHKLLRAMNLLSQSYNTYG